MRRYIAEDVAEDLKTKMVFVGGPRQVGKTTLALDIVSSGEAYLNWDDPQARHKIQNLEIPATVPILIFDELHKFPKWRNWIKGLFDTRRRFQTYLVTGRQGSRFTAGAEIPCKVVTITGACTLSVLVKLIPTMAEMHFCAFSNSEDFLNPFLKVTKGFGVDGKLNASREWLEKTSVTRSGLVTFQPLRN